MELEFQQHSQHVNGKAPSEVWYRPSQLRSRGSGLSPCISNTPGNRMFPGEDAQHGNPWVKQATRGYSGILLAAQATKEIQTQQFNKSTDALSAALATESPG